MSSRYFMLSRRLTVACLKEKHWIDSLKPYILIAPWNSPLLCRWNAYVRSWLPFRMDHFTEYSGERNGEISTTYRALVDAAKSDSDEESSLEASCAGIACSWCR